MAHIIRFKDPTGQVSYWPKGFGFTSHKHAETVDNAERFESAATAWRRVSGYVNPPAFWESERRHAELMRIQFRGWSYFVENIE